MSNVGDRGCGGQLCRPQFSRPPRGLFTSGGFVPPALFKRRESGGWGETVTCSIVGIASRMRDSSSSSVTFSSAPPPSCGQKSSQTKVISDKSHLRQKSSQAKVIQKSSAGQILYQQNFRLLVRRIADLMKGKIQGSSNPPNNRAFHRKICGFARRRYLFCEP